MINVLCYCIHRTKNQILSSQFLIQHAMFFVVVNWVIDFYEAFSSIVYMSVNSGKCTGQ